MYVYHIDLYKLVTLMRRWAVQKTLLAFDVRVCSQGTGVYSGGLL